MIKKANLSTRQKLSTKLSTKNRVLLKKFSTVCPCCDRSSLSSPAILKNVKYFFDKNDIPFLLVQDKLVCWRLKAKLAVRKQNRKLILGLFRKNSHEIATISACRAHHRLISKVASIIEKKAVVSGIIPYNEHLFTGDLRYVQVVVNDNESSTQVTLVINDDKLNNATKVFINNLKKCKLIDSVWTNYNTNKNNVIFSDNWEHFFGPLYSKQSFLNKTFMFHPASFMQAHKQIFEKMIGYIEKNIPENSNLLELYAGSGAIGLSLIPKCQTLTLVENNPFSKLSFNETLKKSFLKYAQKISYRCQNAKSIEDFDYFDTIILDPPRKGLPKSLIDKLADLRNKTIVYVSCNFTSFEKDIEILKKNKWMISCAQCFLMFPGSNHVEIIGVLKKSG